MKILVVGNTGPALELLCWFQELGRPKQADLLGWAESEENSELPKLEVRHTAQAEETIRLVREEKHLVFLSLTGVEISPQTSRERKGKWQRFKRFLPEEREGAWLLTKIKPSRACKRKVAVITADPKRIRRLCYSLDLTGVIPIPIRPETQQAIRDFLVKIAQLES